MTRLRIALMTFLLAWIAWTATGHFLAMVVMILGALLAVPPRYYSRERRHGHKIGR